MGVMQNTMKKVIAIVGNPRSGTSLTCLAHLKILGEHRLIGSKFMGADRELNNQNVMPEPKLTEIQKYTRDKITKTIPKVLSVKNHDEARKKRLEEMLDMNREGFYECPFTVGGMVWSPATAHIWDDIRSRDEEPFCKIVNSGIANTDPAHISKIVYINRNPREVAKSQEKLKGGIRDNLPEGEVIHDPDFYIKSTAAFCRWYTKHGKDIPLLMIDHHDMLTKPEETVKRIAEFHGMPHNNAWEVVKTDLYRSKPDKEHAQFEDADRIYEMMKKQDFQGVVDYMQNPKIITHKINKPFFCHRIGRKVVLAECNNCIKSTEVKANFIIHAENNGIYWKKEPCALECGALDEDGAISIKESIENHSWLKETRGVGDAIERFIGMFGVEKVFGNCKGCKQRKEKLNRMFMRERTWGNK